MCITWICYTFNKMMNISCFIYWFCIYITTHSRVCITCWWCYFNISCLLRWWKITSFQCVTIIITSKIINIWNSCSIYTWWIYICKCYIIWTYTNWISCYPPLSIITSFCNNTINQFYFTKVQLHPIPNVGSWSAWPRCSWIKSRKC